jgi:hypothetical protein
MASWSEKRKFIYATSTLIVIIGVIGIPAFLFFYKAPTCFDGKQNGNEKGVDCGGKCTRLCQNNFLAPNVAWTRLERVVPGIYNAAAYIINPNTEGEAKNVPYHMALYDKDGMLIIDQKGAVTLPPHRNTLAFLPLIKVVNSIPAKVLFEFTGVPDWNKKADRLSAIEITEKNYTEEGNNSSLRVTLKNASVSNIERFAVYVVLYDSVGNAIGFSRTIVDELLANTSVTAPFTWNTNRNGKVVSVEVLYVAE